MILKEQNCQIVNKFEEEKFFHIEVLVKPLSISHLIYSSCLHYYCSHCNCANLCKAKHHVVDMNTIYRLICLYAILQNSCELRAFGENMTGPNSASVNVLTNIMSVYK